ncbi:hypothetical protein [Legionella taurinensis]|uniref:Uncharacterized protein n=1 Tax=Legionella taurinensis TaxID=70611 RepID=A0A3A5LEA4_9GAMM|nr:hypothetical protein [Legionella taurinensis]RJT49130.1 hypothetical protein D6J04_00265 [Legionella taurinensis]RJT67390.1 hypothetical protein D6J03_07225 [Legionella taurinensis]STY26981.1 Uncharacterised protein [Legionella taurinensis]
MSYTKKSAERLNKIQNGWFHVDGNISDSEDPQKKANPFWQFRVAIKPTHENAIKAAEALGRLHQFQKNP